VLYDVPQPNLSKSNQFMVSADSGVTNMGCAEGLTLEQSRTWGAASANAHDCPGEAEARVALKAALPLAEAALKLLGTTPCPSLIEQYARVRRILGISTELAAAVSPQQQATAQVRALSTVLDFLLLWYWYWVIIVVNPTSSWHVMTASWAAFSQNVTSQPNCR
jgi:hypothetical protein